MVPPFRTVLRQEDAVANKYFQLALNEEMAGCDCVALLFYISSFCDSVNSGDKYPYGTVAKIRRLQSVLSITDRQLFDMVHSYGSLTDLECKYLLYFSITGYVSGINAILTFS